MYEPLGAVGGAYCHPSARSGWWGLLPPVRPEPVMTVARNVADVLADHVVFEVECIDRMYCNVYVSQLQYAGGLLGFIQQSETGLATV